MAELSAENKRVKEIVRQQDEVIEEMKKGTGNTEAKRRELES